ncbi:MAG TPA: 23S rRNA (guanosine(2251)-2'-O)-methyltransferase RlmB [Pyrinomonadaceae bacterium]|jgi:23S rRNA (guanosine2251-2'-O)-methyltransferase|nr:23S rRNA (guanosine(2251)-2'-O)-methyltransferase RlmB [Pyrinomonadaceae bacterium]
MNRKAENKRDYQDRRPRRNAERPAPPRAKVGNGDASDSLPPKTPLAPTAARALARFAAEDERGGSAEQLHGVMPVLEALRARRRNIERIMIAENIRDHRLRELLETARSADVPLRRVPRADLDRLARGANHQGVVATVAAAAYRDADELLDEASRRLAEDEKPLLVVLDGVEDPRNLGAIIRTAECAGAHGVLIPERRAVGLTETVAKTAAGALEFLPVARVANVSRLLDELKERGVWTIGVEADGKLDYTEWDWTLPSALFFGGEGGGLHRLVRERCDALVRIPLHGQISSLNVSVAAGVVLYEARRRRAARTATAPASYQQKTQGKT